jgi:hypothetical protein
VDEVAITGDRATARILGSNVVTTARARPSEQRVSLRASLERRGTEWRLLAVTN